MRRQLIATSILAAALATTACATGNGSIKLSPTPIASASAGGGTIVNPTGSLPPPPSGSGAFTHGQASLTLSGGLTQTTSFGTLGAPVVWSPAPGTMTLSWTAADPGESLSVGGPSFSGQQPTSATLTVAFAVNTSKGAIGFQSQAGECTVTINPATATQVGGVIFCTNLKSVTGGIVVNVQGSFSAAG